MARLNALLEQAHNAGITLYVRAEGPHVEGVLSLSPPESTWAGAPRIVIKTSAKE